MGRQTREPDSGSDATARIDAAKFEPLRPGHKAGRVGINPRHCLVAALLAGGALCVWFMLTAKAVYIETEPPDAAVAIAGSPELQLASRYLIRPGAYELELSAPGHQPRRENLVVTEDAAQRYNYRLEKLPGHLRIDSGEVTGAQVFVDDVAKGATPLTIRGLAPGEYAVEVRAKGYFPFRTNIILEGLDREQLLSAELRSARAAFSIASEPPDAAVFSGDELLGRTPLTTELTEGSHNIGLRADGYKVWQDTITVVAGEPLSITGIRLQPADATLFLVSEPAQASVTIDGNYLGLTPLEAPLTPGKTAQVRLFKQGYQVATRSLRAVSGAQKRLSVTLQPELVAVTVKIEPEDAQLYIDGAQTEAPDGVIMLSTGKHEVAIRKPGYVDYETTLTLLTGVEQMLNARLKTVRQARMEAVKPLITAPAGQSLKLFYPDAFNMGASRREPGRQANESLHEVRLTRAFYLAVKEVTNAEYRLFDKTFSAGAVSGSDLNGAAQPVARVTWQQAASYCNWLSEQANLTPFYIEKEGRVMGFDNAAVGYRLPTEAEWAWAARTTGGKTQLKFPWGEGMPPGKQSGNFADLKAAALLTRVIDGYDDGFIVSAPVGSFAPNSRGLFDMGGNVAEWVHDYYEIALNADKKPRIDPVGPASGEFNVIRGASWAHGGITELRLSFRDYGNKARVDVGFRIARYAY